MNFLASDVPSTDSDDDDYVPPVATEKPGVLNLNKKRTAFAPDDDDDDDDSDDDDHPLELEEEDVFEQARLLKQYEDLKSGAASSAGAGPSSAGAGPSSAGAGPSSAGAGPSSSAGAGPSSAGAQSSSAGVGPSSSSAPPRAIPASSPVGTEPPSAPAGLPSHGSNTHEIAVTPRTATPATTTTTTAPASTAQPTPSAAPGADGQRPTKLQRVDTVGKPALQESAASKKPASTIDDIWAEMNASSSNKVPEKQTQMRADPSLSSWLAQPQKPPSTGTFKVRLLGELEEEAKAQEAEAAAQKVSEKVSVSQATGLEAALNIVRGPRKESVLSKTKEVWNEFKGKDEDVTEELEKYKKDKNRYTDKVAFLERTDVREWEYEQQGKRKRR